MVKVLILRKTIGKISQYSFSKVPKPKFNS